MKRRDFLARAVALCALRRQIASAAVTYPAVEPGRTLVFPRDFGSHPAFRTEWWYVTAWVQDTSGQPLGVQVTFFRHRTGIGEDSPSRFAPRQLLFAHAAIADPRRGRLRHDQRVARAGFGLAQASESTTDVHIGDWSLRREGSTYVVHVAGRAFVIDLRCRATQPPLLQGEGGYSRKGPEPRQASYYYSEPQLAVEGEIRIDDRAAAVTGSAWCDHEWSSEVLAAQAIGWDWTGINLADGGALMAFVMRTRTGGALWAGGALRDAKGATRVFAPDAVRFVTRRTWRSPRTQVVYPVAVTVIAGGMTLSLDPLFDDQEQDARGSTGTLYWEGAVRASIDAREVGRGYLELTGYGTPLRL